MTVLWSYATWRSGYPDGPYPSYLGILLHNFDRFGEDAETAYNTGHKWALEVAASKKDAATLEYTFTINAFADHFLQDRFSSGHLRTPRRQLHPAAAQIDGVSYSIPDEDLCSMYMYDEDSAIGLDVTNRAGHKWKCFGDDYLMDPDSTVKDGNAIRARKAVKASADEVYDAWDTSKYPSDSKDYKAWDHAPTLISARSWDQQLAPLFRVDNDVLQGRGATVEGIIGRKNWNSWYDDFGSHIGDAAATVAEIVESGKWDYRMTLN